MLSVHPSLFESLRSEVLREIRHYEQDFAPLVIADFRDDIRTCESERERIHTCRRWLSLHKDYLKDELAQNEGVHYA